MKRDSKNFRAGQGTTEMLLMIAVGVSLALIVSSKFVRPYLGRAWGNVAKQVERGFGQNLNQRFFWTK